jgi:hypothetical protein
MGSGKVGSHVVGAELLAACPPPPSYLLEGPDLGFLEGHMSGGVPVIPWKMSPEWAR